MKGLLVQGLKSVWWVRSSALLLWMVLLGGRVGRGERIGRK